MSSWNECKDLICFCDLDFGVVPLIDLLQQTVHCKVKFSLCSTNNHDITSCLCFIKNQAVNNYWGSGGVVPRNLDLDTRWRWFFSFTSHRFTLPVRGSSAHWIGGWVGSSAGLNGVAKRKISSLPLPGIEPRSSIPSLSHCTNLATVTHKI
jgi:hypothetical protein